ncbi:M81 family metallopeptidase [Marinobacter nanhaiticus D15-8W]|uniref:Microcystinase C n=1 Tax=Marinobacter nanhaiticus D15-8W TaxID=626887 RepID=N6WVP8_9GAMM|nr:M81 family metallopeptidase [Marinobacter nanhaiticus]ENO12923.1 M81 family peptidase [Marinobacter nanhaiticus D15-8W]BES70274.1 M81 family metallopeptidase [Marinobacter nanhaiticus D15-8W]
MKAFVASIATETNTFSPVYTDMSSFRASLYAPPGQHPETPTLCSAPFIAARRRFAELGWELVEGTAAWAEPGGLVNRRTYEHLRDEVLEQLRAAMPVDGVLLGLHGAMVANGYDDCEGDILERVREIVGPDVTVAAELDPHSHLTQKRLDNADLLIAFKEFPHTDFLDRAEELVELAVRHMRGEIKPAMSAFDCRMIEVLPTSIDPMRSFLERVRRIEADNLNVLSISVIHGFMAGDVPDMGTRVLVITDDAGTLGDAIARKLGMELFSFRGRARPPYRGPADAVARAKASPERPVVLADVWDNPGGGVAGDATLILRELVAQGVTDAAVGTIWDPVAVQLCVAAGEGAHIRLRFGGKTDEKAGYPYDAWVTVKRVVRDAHQSFGESRVPLGDAVWIAMDQGIDVILNSVRSQSFSPDLFSNLGIDPMDRHILLIKSTNHFHEAFARISNEIIYVDAGAPYPSDPRTTKYRKLRRDIWPIVENPHGN